MNFLDGLLDWISNWRFNLCFWGSIVVAVLISSVIPNETIQWVVIIGVVLSGIVTGLRWNR